MKIVKEIGPADAETILFVHGAGMAGWMWKMQESILPAFRKVIIDLPDHGEDRASPFESVEAAADQLAALIGDLGPRSAAHLVGHSLGARIVLATLARHPGSVKSAIVSSALVRPSALVSMMNSHALNAISLKMLRSDWMARAQAKQFSFPDPAMAEAFIADIQSMAPENLDRPIAAFCARLSLPPGLERARCPVLVTAGSKEPKSMLGSARDIVGALPDAKLAILDKADHTYPWSRYDDYNRLLTTWFEDKR